MTKAPTGRQVECLRLPAVMTDNEIARHLGLGENTVSRHISEAIRRLGQSSRQAALRYLWANPLQGSSTPAGEMLLSHFHRARTGLPPDPGAVLKEVIHSRC